MYLAILLLLFICCCYLIFARLFGGWLGLLRPLYVAVVFLFSAPTNRCLFFPHRENTEKTKKKFRFNFHTQFTQLTEMAFNDKSSKMSTRVCASPCASPHAHFPYIVHVHSMFRVVGGND